MPFISGEKRKKLDEELATVALEIREIARKASKDDGDFLRRRGPLASYAILKLVTDVYDGSVKDLIEVIGVLEETKMTVYSMYFLPLEQRIVFRRWLDPDGEY